MPSNGAFDPPNDSDIILTDSSGAAILEDVNQMDSLVRRAGFHCRESCSLSGNDRI